MDDWNYWHKRKHLYIKHIFRVDEVITYEDYLLEKIKTKKLKLLNKYQTKSSSE